MIVTALRIWRLFSLLQLSYSLRWSITQPQDVHQGSPATLAWTLLSLTPQESSAVNQFGFILLERELFLFSNQWQVMAIKRLYGGEYVEIGARNTFDVIPGSDMTLRLKNVTDTDLTRYRCTLISSLAAPKSIMKLEVQDFSVNVRLVGGRTPNKGRVEVYYNGYWGTVCSNGWDIPDAIVVCRMLGYLGAWTANCCSDHRGGTGPVWLSQLSCTGNEKSLSDCGHSDWGENNCDHRQDAEVICHYPSQEDTLHHMSTKTSPASYSSPMTSATIPPSPSRTLQIASVFTTDSLSSLVTGVEPTALKPSPSGAVMTSAITTSPPDVYVELVDHLHGHLNQGRVFLYYNGQWGKICDDSWDILDAHVLCRMLGYIRAVGLASFGGANSGPMWLDDLNCTGTEHTLAACVHSGWRISDCNHGKDAGVICDTNHTVRAKDASCNFDTWYCRWDNGPGSPASFKWTRQFGPTPSIHTGPSRDHTSGMGYYIFTEASGRLNGDVARLISPKIQSNGNATCMVFYYHLYGQSMGSLRVKVQDRVLWQISGNQGNSWYKAAVPLIFDGIYTVTFESVIGASAFSDIAVDDVEFQENTVCEKMAESLAPSKIIWISPGREVEVGNNATFVCTAIGRPTPTVLWKKTNGRVLTISRIGAAFLTLFNVTEIDSGIYQCSAINVVANDTKTTVMNVKGLPRDTSIISNVSYNVAANGEHVALQCSSKGFPRPVCRIYHNGKEKGINGSEYIVRNFNKLDEGEYTCNCSNAEGVGQDKLTLTLYESPRIHSIFPHHQLANETGNFELFCNVTGNPSPTIIWTKNGDNSKVYPSGKFLRIENADRSDFGSYKCMAVSLRKENATAKATVELNYYSPIIDFISGNITVLETDIDNVTLFCNTTGRPSPHLTWIRVRDSITMAHDNTLLIGAADRSDRGEYTCVADNGVGRPVSKSVYLDIQYNPSFTRLNTDNINDLVRGNGRIVLTCYTDANPPASQYNFYRDSLSLKTSLTGKYVIEKAKYIDAGRYECVPKNILGTGGNGSVVVSVYGALSIINYPHNLTVNETGVASFFCNATSFPPPHALATHITWSKLGDNDRVISSVQQLVIKDVTRFDSGTYICKAENGLGLPATARAFLDVLHKPYDTRLESSVVDNVAVLNLSFILKCTAEARPPVKIYRFYHNGILVSESSTGILNITRVTPEHNGTYSCIPSNDFGQGENASLNVSFIGPCGIKQVHISWSPLIVGGVDAKAGEWPWQVQLGYFDNDESFPHICGGAILGRYWIVTAAHCVKSRFKLRMAANFNVTVGELQRGITEGNEQNIPVEKIILHPKFNTTNLQNDIALMKLKRPISFNSYVSSICIPDVDFPTGAVCYVTGWGKLGSIGSLSKILQEATIPLLPHGYCKLYYQHKGINHVTADMRCAGTLGQSQGTCQADSGGPLACERDGRWYLLGITSWADGGCMDEGDPGVFANTFYLRNWIKEITTQNT
ncbi:uncharacterized protein [Montipora capricornis]|uniref:uncharacterized protein n=1 Tax=Montipora capricornis TaxID=246305 RepID=UPI0035F1F428